MASEQWAIAGMRPHPSDWTEAKITRLTDLWAEGHSSAEIANRMGISKNAVMGKVHRLGLPGRPSPIRPRTGNVPAVRPKRAPKVMLAIAAPALAPDAKADATTVIRADSTTSCSYVMRSEGKRHFYCDRPTMGRKVYCAEHHKLCHVQAVAPSKLPNIRFDDASRGRICAANRL